MQKNRMEIYKTLAGITDLYMVFMLTFFLFYCGSSGYMDIFSAKLSAFYFLSGAYIIICIVFLLKSVLSGKIGAVQRQCH